MSTRIEDPVRAFLDSVKGARFEIIRSHRKLQELDAQCKSMAARMTGMPGGNSSDSHHDALWAALADQRSVYCEKQRAAESRVAEVERFISGLPDATHRALLTLRYADVLSWPRVRWELENCGIYYSERQLYRLHGEALQAARVLWAAQHPKEGEDG